MTRHKTIRCLAAAVGAAVLLVPGAVQAQVTPTDADSMLHPVGPGVEVQPIITVGETIGDYRFESIPDGIALRKQQSGRVNALINHETSTVPFPYVPGSPEESLSDFTNAMLSELTLESSDAGVAATEGRIVIPSKANYQRFCSNFLARKVHGFERPLLFTNEESPDFVYRTGRAWRGPDTATDPAAEQAGVVVAYDPASGRYRTIYGMGRHNHENSVALEGYGRPVVLSGDDTFSAPASQLYMYKAESADAVWNDRGRLLAFKSSEANDYGDLEGSEAISGKFIRVPREVALGDQTVLEEWSNDHNVFQFIRIEDLAYDRHRHNVVYFADTGEPLAIPDPATGRLKRGPDGTMGPYPNGRVFRMVLDPDSPRRVKRLSILIDGDVRGADSAGDLDLIHNPDNLETTADSLLIQEDPGSQNRYPAGTGTTARVWLYDLDSGSLEVVARVNQAGDPAADAGEWESSGIVDASRSFGPGAFLLDVQAHTLFLETAPGPDVTGDGEPDWTLKREGGQLLLLRIPGA
jgi:hypothetical protein